MATLPLTIKERSLWKRLYVQFKPENLVLMIDKWMIIADDPANFTFFYISRMEIFSEIQSKDYSW